MSIGRYYQPRAYEPELYTPPVQFIGAALEQAQKQYDVNFAAAQGLKNKYIQARTQDRVQANKLQADFEGQIDAIVNKYGGDYSQASKDLYALQSAMGKAYGPGGQAGAIQQNLAIEQEAMKRARERLGKKEGGVDANQVALLESFYKKQKETTLDPTTGVYGQIPSIDLASSVDFNKEFTEILAGVKPRTIERAYRTGRVINGEIESITKKRQYIDPDEVSNAWESKMRNDIGVNNYVSQLGMLSGKDPQKLLDGIVNEYKQNVIPSRTGVLEDSKKLDYEVDWKAKEDYAFKHRWALAEKSHQDAMKRAKFKSELEGEGPDAGSGSSFLALVGDSNSNAAQIPYTQTEGASYTGNFVSDMWGKLLGSGGKEVPTSLNKILADKNSPYDTRRLQSIKDANPAMPDSDIFRLYNDAVSKDTGWRENSRLSYDRYNATPTQQEEANRQMPDLLTGVADLYKLDGATGKVVRITDIKDRIEIGKQFADPKNPLKSKYGALGLVRGDTGHLPSASVIMPDPTGGKKGDLYFIAPNDTDLRNLQAEVLDKAFGWKTNPALVEGDPFPMETPKGTAYYKGRWEYKNGRRQEVYYPVRVDENGNEWMDTKDPVMSTDPVTGQKYFSTSAELEKRMVTPERVRGKIPHKRKADYENELMFDSL